ncbi:helix-turn-helix domain-containing protein [Bacillus salitolerans]|uniref:Helix-turn-helix domain-containing protein n=1 Tax=Bacillus salitolerans TaxID=1437434 RepID=A0ABW4LK15_9BACI
MTDKTEIGYPLVLTANEISELLQISKPTAYEIMNRSDFPLIKFGRTKRVMRQDFLLWLEHKKNKEKAQN